MYLHKDREVFKDIIEQVADYNGRTVNVVEKDYYVTLILRLLTEQLDQCVFKGGISLSKGFHVIDRNSKLYWRLFRKNREDRLCRTILLK